MSQQRQCLVEAASAMAGLGLVTAYGHVSYRSGAVITITPATDLAVVTEADLVEVGVDAENLPPGAPAETWAHLALYRARGDVHAVARAQPASTLAAAATTTVIPVLYGQAAWLGEQIPVHDSAHLLRSAARAQAAAARLQIGEALLLRGNGAVTVASTPGVAVARMWLLDALCTAWLAAKPCGAVTVLDAEEIATWRAVGEELLPRLWRHLQRITISATKEQGAA